MKPTEIEIIRKISFGRVTENELMDIYDSQRNNYRIRFNLVQHPRFPVKVALNIIQQLFNMDLIRVIKNRRTNPFIRKKAEIEFNMRFQRLAMGEKISALKTAPIQLLNHFVEEKEFRIIKTILENPECTEDLILKYINRRSPRSEFYRALQGTDWFRRPAVAEAIIHDREAPIKLLLDLIPLLTMDQLKKLYHHKDTHEIVRTQIIHHFGSKSSGG